MKELDLTGIKAVLFDLGGTLIHYVNNPPKEIYENFLKQLSWDDPKLSYLDFCMLIDNHWTQMQNEFYSNPGAMTIHEFNRIFLTRQGFSHDTSAKMAKPFDELIFDLEIHGTVLLDGAWVLLDYLAEHDYKIGLITNASHSRERIERLIGAMGIHDFFQSIVVSSECGILKPDRRIFDIAMKELDVTADESVYVGNRIDYDIHGAENAGMRGILVGSEVSLLDVYEMIRE